MQHLQI